MSEHDTQCEAGHFDHGPGYFAPSIACGCQARSALAQASQAGISPAAARRYLATYGRAAPASPFGRVAEFLRLRLQMDGTIIASVATANGQASLRTTDLARVLYELDALRRGEVRG